MSKRLDRLERDGLVARSRDDADGRGRVVHLTDAGRRVIDEAFADHVANEARLLADLTPQQAVALEELLTAWLARVEPPAR
ncbi:hypothetical protein ASG41_05740 [Modestobacter sp. Leaf380]|nr:hypothetical protein ASG41_05740 [Modestobacter sp. Leaf380]